MTRKRIIIWGASGAAVIILIAVWFFFIRTRYTGVVNAMPDDVVCFFDIGQDQAFDEFVRREAAMQSLAQLPMFGDLFRDYTLYRAILASHPDLKTDLQNNRGLAGAFAAGKDEVDYLFLLDLREARRFKERSLVPELDGHKPRVSNHVFEKEDVYELEYPELGLSFSFASVNGVFMYSTTPVLIENAILQLKKGDPVSEQSAYSAVESAMEPAPFTFFIHLPRMAEFLSRFSGNAGYSAMMRVADYADWLGLQITAKPTGLLVNGYCAADGDKQATLTQYTGTYSADMHPAVPGNAAVLYRVLTDQLAEKASAKMQGEALNRAFFDDWSAWMDAQLLVGISESLDPNYLKRAFVIIPASDPKLGASKINRRTLNDTLVYRDIPVLELEAGELIAKLSGFPAPEICYGAWLSDALVLTFDRQQLMQMIDASLNRTTLELTADYRDFRTEVSASFNNSIYLNLASCEQLLRGRISDKHVDSLQQYFGLLRMFPRMEMQFTAMENVYMVNGFISYSTGAERNSGLLWSTNMDAPVLRGPFTVLNEITGQRNIVVQDTAHVLYLISANGDVIWKRPLSSPVLSGMHEVDFYGNDKTQFLFNTRESIHLIDIHGEPVEGFPITLTTAITAPVSVFMAAKNDYRFFVACENNNIYGYYKDGKPIAGWNPLRNAGRITLPLFTLPTSKGQAIGFVHGRGIELRNAAGAGLLKLPMTIPPSEWCRVDSALYCMDTTGAVMIVRSNLSSAAVAGFGPEAVARLIPSPVDSMMAVIAEVDGYVKVQHINGELVCIAEPAGTLTGLVALKHKEKAYFGYTLAGGSLVLLDTNGKPLPGFPLQGTSAVLIDDLTQSGDNILITADGNRIVAYRIQ